MQQPLSAWARGEFIEDVWYDFVLKTETSFGRVSVQCADQELGRWGGLFVDTKPTCGASRLYKHLTGQWSWGEKRALCRKLRNPELEWQFSTDGVVKSWKTQINGDEIFVSENGNVWVHGLPICHRKQGLYREISAEMAIRDLEREMDGGRCPSSGTCK